MIIAQFQATKMGKHHRDSSRTQTSPNSQDEISHRKPAICADSIKPFCKCGVHICEIRKKTENENEKHDRETFQTPNHIKTGRNGKENRDTTTYLPSRPVLQDLLHYTHAMNITNVPFSCIVYSD